MKGLRLGIPLFLAILASLFLAPSALSLFFANQALGSVDFDIAKGDERAVAIIGSEPEVRYSSVEGALRAATAKGGSQTVYVLPGISNDNSPILIEEDCQIGQDIASALGCSKSTVARCAAAWTAASTRSCCSPCWRRNSATRPAERRPRLSARFFRPGLSRRGSCFFSGWTSCPPTSSSLFRSCPKPAAGKGPDTHARRPGKES